MVAGVAQTLTAGTVLTGPNSLKYAVSQTGVYNPGANVPVTSIDTGANTNLAVGSYLNWSSVKPNMQSNCQVSVAITGGANAEDDNTLRNRVYLALQSPPQMGNNQQLVNISSSVDGVIQQAFVYSNFNGAGTQLVALTGYQTQSYIGRDIPHVNNDGYVKPYGLNTLQPGLQAQTSGFGAYNQYTLASKNFGQNLSADTSAIYGQLPGTIANPYATVITTVNNVPSDIAAVLSIPYPVGASSNGYGGGWLDYTPFPVPDGYYNTDGYCKVLSVQGAATTLNGQTGFGITIKAASSGSVHTNPPYVSSLTYNNNTPTPGITRVQWVNRSDAQNSGWLVVTATILAATDNGNDTWSLVLDTPLTFATGAVDFYGNTGVAVGDFIFPACANAQSYLNTIMTNYALLGPGQVTSGQGLLALGASRYPSSNAQFPTVMGVQVERGLVSSYQEVYTASVNSAAYVPNSTVNYASAFNTVYTAPATNSPPNIYVPRNIALYPAEFYNYGHG